MTYARFLALFLIVPILGTLLIQRRSLRRGGLVPIALLLAFVYAGTTPWDSAAVAHGLWSFDATRTWPVRVAGLPLEELCFFGLQTVLVGLWVRLRLVRTFGERRAA